MARRGPSLMALLGLVAIAGYQHRDKISEMVADAKRKAADPSNPQAAGGTPSIFDEISGMFSGSTGGSKLTTAISELVDNFRSADKGPVVDSWVSKEVNKDLSDNDLEAALGDETLDHLQGRTGLTRQELLKRLASALPETVNRMTPHGRVPSEEEALRNI